MYDHPYEVSRSRVERRNRRRKALVIAGGALAVLLLLLCGGVLVSQGTDDDSGSVTPRYIGSPKPTAAAAKAKAKAPIDIIPTSETPEPESTETIAPPPPAPELSEGYAGKAGDDFPAGTYRALEDVGQFCYWIKSEDAEGMEVIAAGTPQGGRPQVTLKSGQHFTSGGCGTWRKR